MIKKDIKDIFNRGSSGFTLIELMIVVLIIAILIAIAVPTFLGLRERGYDSQAKSNLRNGIQAAKTYFTDSGSYLGMTAASLDTVQVKLPFADVAGNCVTTITMDASSHAVINVQTGLSEFEACLSVWTKGSQKVYYWLASNEREIVSY